MPVRWTKVKAIRLKTKRGRPWVCRWSEGPRLRQEIVPARFGKNVRLRERYRAALEDRLNGLAGAAKEGPSLEAAVRAFHAAKAAKGLRASTLASYRYVLDRFSAAPKPRALADLLPVYIAPFVGQPGHAPATRRKCWAHLRAFLRWCVRQGHLAGNPLDALEQPVARAPTPFAYQEREVLALLAALKSRPVWSQAALRLAILAGLRIGELADLAAADVDFASRLVRVPAQKSAEDRWVAVDEETAGLLHELRHRGRRMLWGALDAPILTRSMLAGRLRAEVREACGAAGLDPPPKPLQHLRSTFATMAAAAGVSELALAATMGHESIATTRRFYVAPRKARQAGETLRRVQAALDAARAESGDFARRAAGESDGMGDPAGDPAAGGRLSEEAGGGPADARN